VVNRPLSRTTTSLLIHHNNIEHWAIEDFKLQLGTEGDLFTKDTALKSTDPSRTTTSNLELERTCLREAQSAMVERGWRMEGSCKMTDTMK
jgi:hypothetical protein